MIKMFKKRLREPSTWIGISIIAAMAGVPPEYVEVGMKVVSIIAAGAGIALPATE